MYLPGFAAYITLDVMNTSSYRAVDHVMVRLLNIDRLLDLFATVLDIPVSWPKQVSSFATFAWVHVGNTDLELWASTNNSDLPEGSQPPLIHGFALDPADLDASIAELSQWEFDANRHGPTKLETKAAPLQPISPTPLS